MCFGRLLNVMTIISIQYTTGRAMIYSILSWTLDFGWLLNTLLAVLIELVGKYTDEYPAGNLDVAGYGMYCWIL